MHTNHSVLAEQTEIWLNRVEYDREVEQFNQNVTERIY